MLQSSARCRISSCIIALCLAILCLGVVALAPDQAHAAPKPTKIELNVKNVTMKPGDKMKLVVSSTPSNASKNVKWITTNSRAVAVSKSGEVTAKKKGVSVVLARVKGSPRVLTSCMVKVEKGARAKSKTLVAYFSATGKTKGVASYLAKSTGADLYRITPATKYTSKDLKYNNSSSRATKEQRSSSARPQMTGKCASVQDYKTILIGFPIWWGEAPKIVNSFIESYNLKGKKVVLFCTSGSTGIEGAQAKLVSKYSGKGMKWLPGKRLESSGYQAEATAWLHSIKLA